MNLVSKSLLSGIAFVTSALQVWNDLKERFDRVDGSRTYTIHKYIASLQQVHPQFLCIILISKPYGMSLKL